MNRIHAIILVIAAALIVFFQTIIQWPRQMLGVQVDLTPALVVFAALTVDRSCVVATALAGGFFMDALSMNPPGVSALALCVLGVIIYEIRDLVVREQMPTRMAIGGVASVVVTLTVLWLNSFWHAMHGGLPASSWETASMLEIGAGPPGTAEHGPLMGMGTFWQVLILGCCGALATPVIFFVLDLFIKALQHPTIGQGSFRSDRQIVRGRSI